MEKLNPNLDEMPGFGRLTNLCPEKLEELETVLASILALPVARETYAQIIDGTPIRTPSFDGIKAHRSHLTEPIIVNDNAKPSDQAIQNYEKIRATFTPQGLIVDLKVAQAYQNSPPGSCEHMLRLLEIAAASVNTLAGMLYASFHPDTNIKPPELKIEDLRQCDLTGQFYVNFYHTHYRLFDGYPFGLLNVVGYWAEAELFGGVLLFEHVDTGSEVQLISVNSGKSDSNGDQITNAFLHTQNKAYAFQLSEQQLQSFAGLGIPGNVDKPANAETILPFVKRSDARTEPTFVRLGEEPLRIYKNDYDKPPISPIPRKPSCIIKADSEFGKKMERMMNSAHENYPALFQHPPSSQDAYLARDAASSSSPNSVQHDGNIEGRHSQR